MELSRKEEFALIKSIINRVSTLQYAQDWGALEKILLDLKPECISQVECVAWTRSSYPTRIKYQDTFDSVVAKCREVHGLECFKGL